MKFGSVPVAEAEGAILAHSEFVNGTRLRKGETLNPAHIEMLIAAGLREITVARLEPEDLHENMAAELLANDIVPEPVKANLSLTKAFTGRVNITANCPGVVEMDVDALNTLNAIDPMITLATVPPWQQVAPGTMVGTIKIISYGVAKSDVANACAVARQALRVKPVCVDSASLIITEISGGAGEKGRAAIDARLSALGVPLAECVIVPHSIEPLAEAIRGAKGEMVLILTGSATSDLFDVAPEALRRAGGSIERFGMPVDPGNLLFLGALDTTPVIGLPGCARSPALNGADWVLSRVACGVAVSQSDMAEMGVGGLLKEIPTRPMPRERKRR